MIKCPYCSEDAILVTGADIYPHRPDLACKSIWKCPAKCGAHAGCHPSTNTPLGRLANSELRGWKQKAHCAFDPLWKKMHGVPVARKIMYAKLAEKMNITSRECHIGMFDIDMCKKVVELCESGELK